MTNFQVTSRDPDIFFNRVLNDSQKVGYIKTSGGNARGVRASVCFCYLGVGGGSGEKKEMLLISMMALVFSTLVGLVFTARSINSAIQASQDITHAENEIKKLKSKQTQQVASEGIYENTPAPAGEAVAEPSAAQPAQVFPGTKYEDFWILGNPEPVQGFRDDEGKKITVSELPSLNNLSEEPAGGSAPYVDYPPEPFASAPLGDDVYLERYQQALTLLKGRRVERIWAASAQGVMTLGSGYIAAALLIYFLAEYQYFTPELMHLSATGGALVAFGMVSWMGKSCFLTNGREREAAERLRRSLSF